MRVGRSTGQRGFAGLIATLAVVFVQAEPLPDLIVSDLSVSSPRVAGQSTIFTAKIRNQGPGNAGMFSIEYRVNGKAIGTDIVGESGGLWSGESSVETMEYTAVAPGSNEISVVADACGDVIETNELNNTVSAWFEWGVDPDDLDSDQIDDDWEIEHFGSVSGCDPDAICSNRINTARQAYIAGLNPNDPVDKLQLSVLCPSSSDLCLGWDAVSGRVYSVWGTTNLQSGFQCLETNIAFPVCSRTYTNPGGRGFYRLNVELEQSGGTPVVPPPPM